MASSSPIQRDVTIKGHADVRHRKVRKHAAIACSAGRREDEWSADVHGHAGTAGWNGEKHWNGIIRTVLPFGDLDDRCSKDRIDEDESGKPCRTPEDDPIGDDPNVPQAMQGFAMAALPRRPARAQTWSLSGTCHIALNASVPRQTNRILSRGSFRPLRRCSSVTRLRLRSFIAPRIGSKSPRDIRYDLSGEVH